MPQDGVHTLNEGAWHYCGRCSRKAKLDSELQWQNSILVCDDCRDKGNVLVGSIEAARARYMDTIIADPDLRPNWKLTNPEMPSDLDDDIFI